MNSQKIETTAALQRFVPGVWGLIMIDLEYGACNYAAFLTIIFLCFEIKCFV